MNAWITLLLISLLCLELLYLLVKQRRYLQELLAILRGAKGGDGKKAFLNGKGMISQIGFEINQLIFVHHEEVAQLRKLEQANKELLTSLSHDVRTPLTSLLGYLDALESGMVEGAEREAYIRIARRKAYDLRGFVDTLFEWFKIDSGAIKMEMRSTDICELTKEIVIDWLPLLEQKNITPMIQVPDEEYLVELDASAYGRMISNLIQNAVEHSGCKHLHIAVKPEKDRISITIKDDGIGIHPEKLPHIFDRLYKVDNARSSRSSGLGLCIVKELCQMQGGTIRGYSNMERGTTFEMMLPMNRR